jgi:hypothetical protein
MERGPNDLRWDPTIHLDRRPEYFMSAHDLVERFP